MTNEYQSEAARFLSEYRKAHPDLDKRQQEGRARLWDKTLNPEEQEAFRQARVPQAAYVYQTD